MRIEDDRGQENELAPIQPISLLVLQPPAMPAVEYTAIEIDA